MKKSAAVFVFVCVCVALLVASSAFWHLPENKALPVELVVPDQPPLMNWRWAPITPGHKAFPTTPVFEEQLLVTQERVSGMTQKEQWDLAAEKLGILVVSVPDPELLADITSQALVLSIEPFDDSRVVAKFYIDAGAEPTLAVNVGYLLGARDANSSITLWEVLVHEHQHFKQWQASSTSARSYFKGGDHTRVPCNMLLQGEMQAHWGASRWMLERFGQCFDSEECEVVNDEMRFRQLVAELVIIARPDCAGQIP